MFKKILRILLLVLLCPVFCACGDEDTTSSASDIASKTASGNGSAISSENASTGSDTAGSSADATLTIKVKKGEITQFKSNRPYDKSKEDISLILVVGQSNFTTNVGYGGELKYFMEGKTTVEPEVPLIPATGTVYSSAGNSAITALTSDRDVATLADASTRGTSTMGGVSPAFGMQWNAITGTKVVFVQAAVGAVGVHEWTPNPQDYYCICNNNGHNVLYSNAVSNYKKSYEALSKNYNIVYTGYIWNQGEHENDTYASPETGATVCSDEAYYNAYKSMHDGFMEELKLDFGGISVVRHHQNGYSSATNSNMLTIARNAQYKLCNDIDNLYMISNISETTSSDIMDQSNTIHYSQMVFNNMGVECADNLACYLGIKDKKASFSGVKVSTKSGVYIAEFDADGKSTTGSAAVVNKASMTDHILAKLSTLGTGYSISGFTLTAGDKDMSASIDEFGAIDLDSLGSGISTVEIKCVIE